MAVTKHYGRLAEFYQNYYT